MAYKFLTPDTVTNIVNALVPWFTGKEQEVLTVLADEAADAAYVGSQAYVQPLYDFRADILSPSGASYVGFTQPGLGAVTRSLQDKARETIHADDYGLVGDGVTDETTKLQEFFNDSTGKLAILGQNKSYAYNIATGISLPNGTRLVTNGSVFKRLTNRLGAVLDSEYNFIVGNDSIIDKLEVAAVGGISDIGGVLIQGSRVTIGVLKVTAGSSGTGASGSAWNAVRIGPNSGSSSNVRIGTLSCSNFDRPAVIQNVDKWEIGYLDISTYARGLYIKDSSNGIVKGGIVQGLSPNATGTAGENGILIDCTTGHGASHDIRIENVTVDGSGEHAFRIGGSYDIRNVWHTNCHAKNPGAGTTGTYPPNNNGGCGFKCLGPTATTGTLHQNIHYIDCSVEDINATSISNLVARGGKTNFAGFQIAKVHNLSLTNPVVGKRPPDAAYTETGNSSFNGIEIIGCRKVTITNPQIQRPYNSGIYIYDFSDGVNDWGQMDDVDIVGGHVNTPGVAGVEVSCGTITMNRVSINGLQVNAGNYSMLVTKTGTGAFSGCTADIVSVSPATESFSGLGTDWLIRGRNSFIGTNACKNGSSYNDATNGVVKSRVSGQWVDSPILSYGTYTPTLFNTTNITASTASQCQWSRVGNVVTVSGRVNLTPTAASVATTLGVSLPITPTFTSASNLGGTAATAEVAAYSAGMAADTTNNRAFLFFVNGTNTGAHNWYFTCQYLIG